MSGQRTRFHQLVLQTLTSLAIFLNTSHLKIFILLFCGGGVYVYTYADVGAPTWKPDESACPALSGQGLSLNLKAAWQSPGPLNFLYLPLPALGPGMK